jgi:uncharacterized repeat protein (TIGR03803 family)
MIRPLIIFILALLVPLGAADYELVTQFARAGEMPLARLAYVPTAGKFFGTTSTGGAYDKGTVFSYTIEGTYTTLVSFSGVDGPAKGDAPDAGLVLGADGNLYGVTTAGGANDCGTIFRMSTAGSLTTLIEFTGMAGAAKGSAPNELTLASDGDFYGTTQAGGANEHGTIFRLNLPVLVFPASVTTLTELKGPTGAAGTPRGSMPVGALVSNGSNLYGVTAFGGTPDHGMVFRVTTSGAWTAMAQFTGTTGNARGANPAAGLVLHSDGSLYGTTEFGGSDDAGTVFRIATTGSFAFTSMHSFDDTDGARPAGALVMGADQALYGTTSAGGEGGAGTIFRIETMAPHPLTVLEFFTGQSGAMPGEAPRAGLILGPGGDWFGTTSAGGPGDYGTLFALTSQQQCISLASLGNAKGWLPTGGVTVDATGGFLLPLTEGGPNGGGTLIRRVGNTTTVEASFGDPLGTAVSGSLVRVGADFYGVTRSGGIHNRGTFFRYTPGTGVTTLADLSITTGAAPEGPLTLGPDGRLYGVAREGGVANRGAIIRFDVSGTVTRIVSFTGTDGLIKGTRPRGSLTLATDGTFYGVTEAGGTNDRGTIFQVTTSGAFTTLHEFGTVGPAAPRAGLRQAPNGILYGTTARGGAGDFGTVFQIATTGELTTLAAFSGANGAQPNSRLFVALDGTLYGTTLIGGAHDLGTVFTIRPSSALQTIVHLTGSSGTAPGEEPLGDIIQGPDGMLYGVASSGGSLGGGGIFRITGFGPHVVTDPPGFVLALATLRGRVQTGGQLLSILQFQLGTSPDLLLPLVGLPSSSTDENGVMSFTLPVPNLLVGQTVYYRAVVTTLLGPTSTGDIRSFTVPSPLAGWKLSLLGDNLSGDLDDPDLDGLVNLLEYALLKHPTTPDAGPPTAFSTNVPGDKRLAISVDRDPARNDVTISVQAASALSGPWSTIAQSVNGAPFTGSANILGDGPGNGPRTVQIQDITPISSSIQRYLRVLVSH